ncbi:MAG: crotonase/enoyl-CoA hydratase family protein [Dehalococcoidales bacterium]|nr:crotonase/enoyl-CoA hydratase family protein [Dehalococcoidales bacterium]
MDYIAIQYEKKNRIAYITLNRPDKLNALNLKLRMELIDALNDANNDQEIHCIVIKANGRAFSAGYDISGEKDGGYVTLGSGIRDDLDGVMQDITGVWNQVWNSRKPVIGQVHGYCLAGGTDLALNCDITIAAEDAQMGFPAVRAIGAPPTHMWTYLAGPQWAKYLLLTGNSVDGKTAEKIGLIWKAVPKEKLDEEVNNLAVQMTKIPYGLLAVNKRIVNKCLEAMGRGLLQELAAEADAIGHLDPFATEFSRITAEKGLTAALNWRDQKFGDYRTKDK